MITYTTPPGNTYYSYSATGTDPTLVASWWTGTAGTGTHPANFTSGDTFIIQSANTMTATAAWTVSGGATITINSGGTLDLANKALSLGGNFNDNGSFLSTGASAPALTFTASGTFTTAAASSAQVECWGGGGAGGSAYRNPGSGSIQYAGGGAGGAYARLNPASNPLTPATTYYINVGAGAANASSVNATTVAGGDSWFNTVNSPSSTIIAKGGAGGASAIGSTSTTFGAGGTATAAANSHGDQVYAGGSGAAGIASSAGGGGSSAGNTATGVAATSNAGATAPANGGNGGTGPTGSSAPGGAGSGPGGGGSGARASAFQIGGGGANGQVVLTYYAAPTVTSSAATALTNATATLNGSATGNGPSITEHGFYYQTTAGVTTGSTKFTASGTGDGAFTASPTLTANTTYYWKAYAINTGGTVLSAERNFTTLASVPTTQPALGSFSSVLANSLIVNLSGGNGASNLVVVSQGSAVSANPTNGSTYTANATFGSGSVIGNGYASYLGTGISFTLSGLTPGTTYYVAVYALNGGAGSENYLTLSPATGSQATSTGPTIIAPVSLTGFGNNQVNTPSATNSYTLSGTSLSPASGNLTVTPPANFAVSLDHITWVSGTGSMNVAYTAGSLASTTIYVRFQATAIQSYSGSIVNAGGGASSANTTVSGTGIAVGEPTLSASASQPTTINLTLGLNSANNNVVVVRNSTGSFSTPSPSGTSPTVGGSFGGGTVIAYGTATSVADTEAAGTSYYKAWSYDGVNYFSPGGVTASANLTGSFYSDGSHADPTSVGSWWSGTAGTGNHPVDFTRGDTFVIQASHSMTAGTVWSVSGTGAKVDVHGTLNLTVANALTLVSPATMTLESDGTLNHSGAVSVISGGTLTFNGTYKQNMDQGFIPTATWDPASTCEIDTTFASSPSGNLGYGQIFGNFIWNAAYSGAGPWTLSWAKLANLSSTATIQGTLTVEYTGGGTAQVLAMRNATSQTFTNLTVGAFSQSGGSFQLANSSTHPVAMMDGGNFTLSGGTCDIHGSSSLYASNNVSLTGTGVLTSGTLNFAKAGTQSLTVSAATAPSCAWNILGGATVSVAGATTLGNGGLTIAGGFDANGQTFTNTGLTSVSGGTYTPSTAPQILTGGLLLNGGTVNAATLMTVANVTLNSGSFTAPGAAGTFNVTGNFTNNGGTFTPNSGTVTFAGTSAQNIGGTQPTAFTSVTDANTNQSLSLITNVTVDGTFSVNSNAVLSPLPTTTLGGTGTLTGNGTILVTATGNADDLTTQYPVSSLTLFGLTTEFKGAAQNTALTGFGSLKVNNATTLTLGANSAKTVGGTLTVTAGSTLDLNGGTLTTPNAPSLGGALIMEVNKTGANTFAGSKLTQTSGTLTYGGTLTVSATGSALADGDSIPLFASAAGFGGGFSSATVPTLTGYTANAAQLTGGTGGNLTYAVNSYTLAYAAGANGTLTGSASQSVNYGASGSPVTANPNTGYHFTSWTDGVLTALRTDTALLGGTNVTANFAITAYTVSFVSNGGSSVTSQSVNYNATATSPADPTRTGYNFAGWYADSGLTSAFSFSTAITANTPLYAKWNISAVTFDLLSTSQTNGYRDTLYFTATNLPVGATSNVVFQANGTPFSTNTVSNGGATSLALTNLPRGSTNIIVATYSGDTVYPSAFTNLIQTVTNHPPVAAANAYSRNHLYNWKIAVADLLTNASDVLDGDTLTLIGVSSSTNLVTLDTTSSPGYVGYYNANPVSDQFSYTVTDGFGGTNTATITLNYTATTPVTGTSSIAGVTGTNPKVLTAFGIPNYNYITERSTNLTDWVDIATNAASTNGTITITDYFGDLGSNAPASAYYRLKW